MFQDHFSLTEAGGFAQSDVGVAGQAFRLMTDYYSVGVKYSFWFDDFDINFARDRSQWLHLFATFDNTTHERKIYIDGDLLATNVAAYGFSGTGPMRFGFMEGTMDEVRVYDRAISAAEVGQIYSSELTPTVVPDSASVVTLIECAGLVIALRLTRKKSMNSA